ncbi:glutaredoxin family protein [Microbacterium sp. NPDC089318]
MTTVTVYSTGPSCQRCRLTCQRLDALGIRYDLVDIHDERNAALRAFLVDELGYREAPIVQVGRDRWSGFRPDLIDALAEALGVG